MLNDFTIMGRLTADPEMRTTTSGTEITTFTVAVDRDYKSGGETQTDFFRCQAFRQNAIFVSQYFSKGRMIAVNGSMQSRNYEDKHGVKRTAWEVMATKCWFCGDKQNSTAPAETVPAPAETVPAEEVETITNDDDLPF